MVSSWRVEMSAGSPRSRAASSKTSARRVFSWPWLPGHGEARVLLGPLGRRRDREDRGDVELAGERGQRLRAEELVLGRHDTDPAGARERPRALRELLEEPGRPPAGEKARVEEDDVEGDPREPAGRASQSEVQVEDAPVRVAPQAVE